MRKRGKTNRVIFHHALAKQCTIQDIIAWHVFENRWADVGYHALVRKSGEIQFGRDIDLVGAHAKGRNGDSIGICLEGDFRSEEPPIEQIEAAGGLYHVICRQHGKNLKVCFHRPHIFNLWEPSSYGMWNACPGPCLDRVDFKEQMAKYAPF